MQRGIIVFRAGLFVLLSTLSAVAAQAQTLDWGINGVGGSGTWDTTTTNWFNGTSNVAWSSGGDAVFGGATGAGVTVSSTSPVVSSITFNTAGYGLLGGTVQAATGGLTITTNVPASISSTIHSANTSDVYIKDGAAPLTLSGFTTNREMQVNQGELLLNGQQSLSLTLANTPGVMATLSSESAGNSILLAGLNGGGVLGGVVQPATTAGALTLDLTTQTLNTFGGVIQNNGAATLAVDMGFGSQTFTGMNTYSGATTLSASTLTLSGNGSIANSAVSVGARATFAIDNSAAALANRISPTLPVSLSSGTLLFAGNASTPVNQTAGQLNLANASNITVTQPGSAAAELSFAGLNRSGHATLDVSAPGVQIAGVASGATGIVAPYITAGNEWATIGGDGRITPWTNYASDINSGANTDHVKITASGTTSLAASSTRASLNMQNPSALTTQTLDLAGNNLTLTSGGLLTSGAASGSIVGGQLSSAASEMVVTTNNDLTIGAAIADGNAMTTLNKTGPGTLTLSGISSYTGPTVITQGTLVPTSDASLGQGSTVLFNGGILQAGADFASTKGFSVEAGSSATVNTGGHNVSFSGTIATDFTKTGPGTLTLTGSAPNQTSLVQGTLALPNGATGAVALNDGTLQAAGTLNQLSVATAPGAAPRLDIGGPAAATLTTTTFADFDAVRNLAIDFGLGSAASDLWRVGSAFWPTNTGNFQFEFHNLGGLTTGVSYPLIDYGSPAPAARLFQIVPDLVAAGWAGTFNVSGGVVSVTFSAVPEPGTTALVALQGIVLACAARRGLAAKQRKKRGIPAGC